MSAFRFGFIDLSWGSGGGGSSFISFGRALSPLLGLARGTPAPGELPPTPAPFILQDIPSPRGLSCRAPSVLSRGGSWITSQSPCPYQNAQPCLLSPQRCFCGAGGASRPSVRHRAPLQCSPHSPAQVPQPYAGEPSPGSLEIIIYFFIVAV